MVWRGSSYFCRRSVDQGNIVTRYTRWAVGSRLLCDRHVSKEVVARIAGRSQLAENEGRKGRSGWRYWVLQYCSRRALVKTARRACSASNVPDDQERREEVSCSQKASPKVYIVRLA